MNSCTEALGILARTEAPATALQFLDLILGGFDTHVIELTLPLPHPNTHVFVFLREGERWVELEGCVRKHEEKLHVTLPAGPLRHITVALVPRQS